MENIHHVPMIQEYTKNNPQACTIASSPCNQTGYKYTNTTKMYYYSMYHTNITKMYHESTRHASQACTILSRSIIYNQISILVTCCTITLTCNSSISFIIIVPTFLPNFPWPCGTKNPCHVGPRVMTIVKPVGSSWDTLYLTHSDQVT